MTHFVNRDLPRPCHLVTLCLGVSGSTISLRASSRLVNGLFVRRLRGSYTHITVSSVWHPFLCAVAGEPAGQTLLEKERWETTLCNHADLDDLHKYSTRLFDENGGRYDQTGTGDTAG